MITSAWRYDLLLWFGNLTTRGKWQALRHRTIELAQLQPGEHVLEVGCGTGTVAQLAKQQVGDIGRVCGTDPSQPMIARARRKAAHRGLVIDFQPGIIERLPFPDQTFDVVLSSFMMHQIPDELKRQGLAEVARVLRPGGRLVIVDTKRPEQHSEGSHRGLAHSTRQKRPVHVGVWNSGVQDQPALMAAAGFSEIESGELETQDVRLPEIGFALGRIGRSTRSDSSEA